MDISWVDSPTATKARLGMLWMMKPPPDTDGRYGRLVAVDLVTRKPVWTNRTRALPDSSLLVTAGGLLFSGSTDRMFRALDAKSGKTLWETRLDAPPNATPITFTVGGQQYVAIVSGAGGDHPWQAHVPESRYLKAALCRVE